jgi:multisubunit Na+/H+ antiporter MnhC subunit
VVFALVVGLAGCVLAISAARRARRDETMRPRGWVAGLVLGIISIGMALIALVGIIFSRQLTNYDQCIHNATSSSAQQTCTRQLLRAVESGNGQKG